jgi:Fe-S cluster biogenesis protein NfuA
MASHSADREFRKRMERVESLIREVEEFPDADARTRTEEILRTVLELHSAGLERILEKLSDAGEPGLGVINDLAGDEVVGSLFLLHGLHPLDLETRVQQALENVRPLLRTHGGNVELIGVCGGVARLRMLGSCHGCPSSAITLRTAIEDAIYDKAPDVAAIELDEPSANGHAPNDGKSWMALPILGQ